MSDVALVALIISSATVLVSLIGVASTVWGAAWREGRQQEAERARQAESLRYSTAQELISAIAARENGARTMGPVWDVTRARAKFIATLRPGEGAAEHFTRRMIDVVHDGEVSGFSGPRDRPRLLEVHADRLFAWLRGEITADELEYPMARWAVSSTSEARSGVSASVEVTGRNDESPRPPQGEAAGG